MITNFHLQPSPDLNSTLEKQAADNAFAWNALSASEPSPYVTPMVQYYLEREAEWARG